MERYVFGLVLLVSALLTAACSDSGEDRWYQCLSCEGPGGMITAVPNPVIIGGVNLGSETTIPVTVTNVATAGTIEIRSVRLVEDTLDDPAGEEFARGTEWFSTARLGPGESRTLDVLYRPNDTVGDSGKIELDVVGDEIPGIYEIPIATADLSPDISTPSIVRFPRVAPVSAETIDQAFSTQRVENIGSAPLLIGSISLTGGSDYTIRFYTADPGMDGTNEGSEIWPAELAPEESFWYRLYFNPETSLPSNARVSFFTNDPDEATYVVDVEGNRGPCLEFSDGDEIDFGEGGIGYANTRTVTVLNCSSSAQLEVGNIAITDDAGGIFSVVEETLPREITHDEPLVLEPAEQIAFVVLYTPIDESVSTGELIIESNDSSKPSLTVPIVGRGAANACPRAIAQGSILGGQPSVAPVVVPGTIVTLDGSHSLDSNGSITRYEWSLVSQPPGSEVVRLFPSSDVAEASIRVDAYGVYVIELIVFDDGGLASCESATVTVHAIPAADFVVMLTWETPGDADLRDDLGADLDLHFKRSTGAWNTSSDDIWWNNPTADWGAPGPVGNPFVTMTNDTGAGPEIIEASGLANGTYAIGVHYYADSGFGPSTATVRTYPNGTVGPSFTQELSGQPEFWYVADLVWSTMPAVVPVGVVSNWIP